MNFVPIIESTDEFEDGRKLRKISSEIIIPMKNQDESQHIPPHMSSK